MSASSKAARLRNRMPAIDPDSITAPPPPAIQVAPEPPQSAPEPAPNPIAPEPVSETPAASQAPETPASKPAAATKAAAKPAGEWETTLDDPAIAPGRSNYRSFHVEDTIFARFRAAIYWSSRREESVGEVPENMSVAISEYMERTASELEKRFNDGKVFRPTPEQRKKRKTRVSDK